MPTQPVITDQEILQFALVGFTLRLNQMDAAIASIRARLGQRGPWRPSATSDGMGQVAPKRRAMSATARKRIGEATRRRWETLRLAKAQVEKVSKPKRKLSKAGRAAIIAATKKRWAAVHKAQKAIAKRPMKAAA